MGPAVGRARGEGALEAGTVTNKAAALSDVRAGRRGGWEEEERGRKGSGLQSPEPGDRHSNACRWNAKDRGEKW